MVTSCRKGENAMQWSLMIRAPRIVISAVLLSLIGCGTMGDPGEFPDLSALRLVSKSGDIGGAVPSMKGKVRVLKFWGDW